MRIRFFIKLMCELLLFVDCNCVLMMAKIAALGFAHLAVFVQKCVKIYVYRYVLLLKCVKVLCFKA